MHCLVHLLSAQEAKTDKRENQLFIIIDRKHTYVLAKYIN